MYLRSNLEYLLKCKDSNAYRLQIEANIPQPTIQRILTGKTDNPRQETLKNLSAWSGYLLVICENADVLAKKDYIRLTDAANDVASSIADIDTIRIEPK